MLSTFDSETRPIRQTPSVWTVLEALQDGKEATSGAIERTAPSHKRTQVSFAISESRSAHFIVLVREGVYQITAVGLAALRKHQK